MPILQLKNVSQPAEIRLSDAAFGRAYNEALVHQVVTAYMAAGRAGTKRQKSRAEVRGGGKKPWAQKGTGQARAGSIRSPIWVGGGRAFAARPRDYAQKVNRKMYRAAMQSMVSELVRQDRLIAIESLELSAPKTKLLIGKLQEFGLSRALILVEAYEEKLFLAARNVPYVDVLAVSALDPLSLIKHDKVLATVGALKLLEQRLGGANGKHLDDAQEQPVEGAQEQHVGGAHE
jgi:large subunit ribosomal protein L4